MKKYYMSFVDFSEIVYVTADEELLLQAKERMTKLGLLTEKGNPSTSEISSTIEHVSAPFFAKLQKRIARRPGGIVAVRDTMKKLYDKKEYTAVFLYLSFLYGFLEWRVPERVRLLPAAPEALKYFAAEFISAFDKYLEANVPESEENAEDAEQTDM